MTRWPDAVWRSPWLVGMAESAREGLQAAGTLRVLEKGALLFGRGDPADAVYVVSEGLVDVRAVRRGETEARSLRRAAAGDAVGEEALVQAGTPRRAEARCTTRVVVAEVPVAVFRRAAEKGDAAKAKAVEATLRRAAGRDALRSSSVGWALPEKDVESLAASAEVRVLGRGEVLFAAGDPAPQVFVVGQGMVEVRAREGERGGEREARARVRAYLAAGDVVADGALEAGGAHDVTVAASGPAWVLGVPRAELVERLRRVKGGLESALRRTQAEEVPVATRHVMGDLWRFQTASSMLVIDDEVCVRCGACTASCASVHDDGVSRLVRRGEKVAVHDAHDGSAKALLLPGSCQHCKHPACMIDCPTGAIRRDGDGRVSIREELCVGCGRCATACPWGAMQMAPRPADAVRHLPVLESGDVAVKCDLCSSLPSGPACVSACPVDAIARIEPERALAETPPARPPATQGPHLPGPPPRETPPPRPPAPRAGRGERERGALPVKRSGTAWIVSAIILAAAVAHLPGASHGARWATGALAGLIVLLLAAYPIVKKLRLGRVPPGTSRVRPHTIAHTAFGTLALGLVVAHVGQRVAPNAAGALLLAFAVVTATGIAGAIVYRVVPRALSRVERKALLPEDLARRARDLDDRAFGALTGRSDATKAVYAAWVAPYTRSRLGGIALLAGRKTLRAEEAALYARIERALGPRAATLDGVKDIIRLAVERRALRAQWLLQTLLRGWTPVHVVAAAVTVALLALHVVIVTRGR